MLTEEQLAALIDSLTNVERLVLVGDPRQLPPIGAGRPFVDIIRLLEPAKVESLFPRCGTGYAELTIPRRQQHVSGYLREWAERWVASNAGVACRERDLPVDSVNRSIAGRCRHWYADVAILEQKDFDYLRGEFTPGPNGTQTAPSASQALRALWNAGDLTRVTLLGSTLTSILQQNTSNLTQNFQSLGSVRESEQLRVIGIAQEHEGGPYYIRGVLLDASKLYAVATSDNLANSSSDYSSLASQDQNLPEVFWDYGKTISIADLANTPVGQTATLWEKAQIEPLFPNPGLITKKDIDQAVGKTAPFDTNLTHSTRTIFDRSKIFNQSTASDLGKLAQMEPFWHVTIQQASFSYTDSKPSELDSQIGANFGGVSNPNVVTPHSSTISFVYDDRVEYYLKRGTCGFCLADFGADAQINVTRSAQGSTTPPPALPPVTTSGAVVPTTSISYPANTYVLSPFFETQTKVESFWKPLVFRPGLFTTQVLQVQQFLPSSTTATTTTPAIDFELNQDRTYTAGSGLGTRLESNDYNYLELGYSFQRSFDVLSSISEPGQTACLLTSTMTVTKCASTLPGVAGIPLSANYSDYSQQGGYFLGMLTLPFFPKPVKKTLFLCQGTAYGNFFAYGRSTSSSALTHYAFAMNNTFQIALPANSTFGPSYNLFYFQANEHEIGESLHRRSFSAQVNYSFDWHTGLSVRKSLLGKVQ
jgi:hypothetical protein